MEKEARASFRVFRINRWSLALALLAVVAAILLPLGRLVPVFSNREPHVAPGVTVFGRTVGGASEAALRSMLTELAATMSRPPVSAQIVDRVGAMAYVIPEMNGTRLDVDGTVFRILNAPAGAEIAPVVAPVPAARRVADYPHLPIYSVNPSSQAVGLLINVAWGEEHLPNMLAALKAAGARATFFLVGRWAEKYPDLVRRILADGHELANHGYDDGQSPFDMQKKGTLEADIRRATTVIEGLSGKKLTFYAPHMGEVNEQITRTAATLGYRTVLWSLDTVDWKQKTAQEITSTVLGKVKTGDLILMHPTAATNQALPAITRGLADKGLKSLTLTELTGTATPAATGTAAPSPVPTGP